MKEEDQVLELVDVTELVALSAVGSHVHEAKRKERKAMYSVRTLHNIDSVELLYEHEPTHVFCWTLYIWYSMAGHMMSKAVTVTQILIIITCRLKGWWML